MSDASPNPQIPDAVSPEALRQLLGGTLPDATALRQFRFGDTSKHEGIYDFLLLLLHICGQEEGAPSVVQTIGATSFLIDILDQRLRPLLEESEERITNEVEKYKTSNPMRSAAAQIAKEAIAADNDQTRAQLSALKTAIGAMSRNAIGAMFAVEKLQFLGPNTPNPGERQRFFSDTVLEDLGIDRATFDTYFSRRSRD